MGTETKIQASIGRINYKTKIHIRGHLVTADELRDNGGQDEGPTPHELVLAGLAACTASTLKMYADRKGWPIEKIFLDMGLMKEKSADGYITHISRLIRVEGDVSTEQKQRLVEIAEKCPVHRMLTNEIQIKTEMVS